LRNINSSEGLEFSFTIVALRPATRRPLAERLDLARLRRALGVCACVPVCVCMYIFFVRTYVCFVCMYTFTYVYMCVCTYVYVCAYIEAASAC